MYTLYYIYIYYIYTYYTHCTLYSYTMYIYKYICMHMALIYPSFHAASDSQLALLLKQSQHNWSAL